MTRLTLLGCNGTAMEAKQQSEGYLPVDPAVAQDDGACCVDLPPDGSVYQDAVFMPLVQCCDASGRWTPKLSVYSKVLWLLLLNLVLQSMMAYKMLSVTESTEQDFRNDVMSLCQYQGVAEWPWWNGTLASDTRYFDCGPLVHNVMSNVDTVDLDKNGNWSFEEASRLESEHDGVRGRLGLFKHVFYGTNFFRDAHADVHRDIPMAWLHERQAEIQLCGILDPALCGNMEVAGFLSRAFPSVRGKEVRVHRCAKNFEEEGLCRSMFGTRFEYYIHHMRGICGNPSFEWDKEASLNVASFDAAQKWTTNWDSISSRSFSSFMLLIMLVWFMLMMSEFHQVMRWLAVLLCIETCPSGEVILDAECGSGEGAFKRLPTVHRSFVLLLVWLPRALIFGLTTFVGTVFLGASTDYIDLLLNATALGFLIEIDQMLHHACTDDLTRQQVGSCKPLAVMTRNPAFALHQKIFTGFYSSLLVAASCVYVGHVNFQGVGNQMISKAVLCLCGIDGEQCLGHSILSAMSGQPPP